MKTEQNIREEIIRLEAQREKLRNELETLYKRNPRDFEELKYIGRKADEKSITIDALLWVLGRFDNK